MATKVTKEEVVTLQDGKELEIKPLNLKHLRKFMGVMKEFESIENEEQSIDLTVQAVQICIEKGYPEIAEDTDYLEENLDMNTVNQILSVAGGVDLSGDTPNPNTAA